MDIQTFIKETLVQIANGVASAREEAKKKGVLIGQPCLADEKTGVVFTGINIGGARPHPFMVNFDVAVSTTKSADGGLKILEVLGVKGNYENAAINRVRFEVPVSWIDHQPRQRG